MKKKLTAVAGFVTYGAGRTVVRQGQYAYATYFISSGEITISITSWDKLLQEWVTKDVGMMGPGDMFGEVSLLHDIPRTANCTTSSKFINISLISTYKTQERGLQPFWHLNLNGVIVAH